MAENTAAEPNNAPDTEPKVAPFPVVGIGASAGGLEALTQLVQALPPDTGMAFVVVQHLHPTYPSNLSELLSRATTMPVREVAEAMPLEPNHVFVIPPNMVMTLSGATLHLTGRPEGRHMHMPIDLFLQSLAQEYTSQAIGVILSGTGTDGTQGLEAIKAEGGISFAQDASARFETMPQSAVAAGCVDAVLSPRAIAEELVRISKHPYVRPVPEAVGEAPPEGPIDLKSVYALLQRTHGVDFTYYKQSTIRRRIERRMVLHRLDTIEDYYKLLQAQPEECKSLFQDVLITVTSFFRDPDSFEALKLKVYPELMKNRAPDAPIRIWVVGCSSGEEAYSLAITLLEYLEGQPQPVPIRIFATDVAPQALEKARVGIYPESISANVSPERLRRYFTRQDGGYQISKAIRDLCVFARQDVTRDPPFANMDLVSCRNLLIYLDPVLQRRVLPILHYALADRGFLFLGNSESVGAFAELFTLEDNKHKLYRRNPGSKRLLIDIVAAAPGSAVAAGPMVTAPPLNLLDVQREADRVVLSSYAPAGVVINEGFEVVQFRGKTGTYLEPAPGLASLNVLKMAREGLMLELRSALEEARKTSTRVRRTGLQVKTNDHYEETSLEVIPILIPPNRQRFFIVLFEPAVQPRPRPPEPAPRPLTMEVEAEKEIVRLQQELNSTRDYLQSLIETLEAHNEELKAANEEILSSNEELQSTNEELQTAKEEVQATNEELTTTNDELQHRNRESQILTNDLTNLLTSVQIPILMLGQDLCIRRFTPSAGKVFNLIQSDVGRPISNLKPRFNCPEMESLILQVIEDFSTQEREVQDDKGNYFWLCIRPYRTADNKIDGAVLSFMDITQQKQTQEAIRASETRLRNLANAIPGMVYEYRLPPEGDGQAVFVSEGSADLLDLPRQQASPDLTALWSCVPAEERQRLQAAYRTPAQPLSEEYRYPMPNGTVKWLHNRACGQVQPDGSVVWYGVINDVTQRRQVEEQLRESLREQQTLLRKVHHRVKNNLQIISSMLQIQARMAAEPRTQGLLQECQQRVATMAHIHETLYRSGALRQIDFAEYGRRLAEDLVRLYANVRPQISLSTLFDPIAMELDVAIPCGLILNELVSNAVKHAFAERASGQLVLSLKRGLSEQVVLSVADNGVGFPADWETRESKTLGLHLVKILAQQLRGTVAVRRRDGWTEVEVAFKIPEAHKQESNKQESGKEEPTS